MPHLNVNGCDYFYLDKGGGPETIFFGHGYLMTHRLFDEQIAALEGRYRCVAVDWRGQGQTEVTAGGYGVPSLAEDAIAVIEKLGIGPCHYVGLSMGGYVGYHVALKRPDLLRTLSLLDTQAAPEAWPAWLKYHALLLAVRFLGYGAVMGRVLPIMFGPDFLHDPTRQDEVEKWKSLIQSNDRKGIFRAGLGIFNRPDVTERLPEISTPALVLTGEDDVPTPVAAARTTHAGLPNAELVTLPRAGHSSAIERPDAVTDALAAFLQKHSAVPR